MTLSVLPRRWLSLMCIGRDQNVGSIPPRVWQFSFVKIDHEIFSVVILSLVLIQKGQLLVSGERICITTG